MLRSKKKSAKAFFWLSPIFSTFKNTAETSTLLLAGTPEQQQGRERG